MSLIQHFFTADTKWMGLTVDKFIRSNASTALAATDNWMASDIKRLSANKILVIYAQSTNSAETSTRIVVGDINADKTITFGTSIDFGNIYRSTTGYNSNYVFNRTISILSDTSFVVSWTNDNEDGMIRAGTVSGTTITLGTSINLGSASIAARYINTCALDATNVLVWFREWGVNGHKVRLFTISGTTMTYRSSVTVESVVRYDGFLEKINSTTALLHQSSNGAGSTSRVISVSGTTVSAGAAVETKSGASISNQCSIKLGTNWLFFYDDETSGLVKYMRWASISGTTITLLGSEINVTAQYPTFTSDTTSCTKTGGPLLVEQSGSVYYLIRCMTGGTATTTERPMVMLHKIIGDTCILMKTIYMNSSTTLYSLMDKNVNCYIDYVDENIVGITHTVDSATYGVNVFVGKP